LSDGDRGVPGVPGARGSAGDHDVTFADIDAFVALIGTTCP